MRRAIALDPQESGYHYLLGMMLAAAGDFDAARQAQRRALVIDPQNVQAYIALSNLALLQNGDVDAATRVLDQMAPGTPVNRSEERRVGKEGVRTCRSRGSPCH